MLQSNSSHYRNIPWHLVYILHVHLLYSPLVFGKQIVPLFHIWVFKNDYKVARMILKSHICILPAKVTRLVVLIILYTFSQWGGAALLDLSPKVQLSTTQIRAWFYCRGPCRWPALRKSWRRCPKALCMKATPAPEAPSHCWVTHFTVIISFRTILSLERLKSLCFCAYF